MPYVTDTHSLIWHMTSSPGLSIKAKSIFRKADDAQEQVFIPCIVFFELLYLVEKKKIAVDFGNFIKMVSASKNYKVEPMCLPIIEKTRNIPRKQIPYPWDRLIAATSIHLNLPLITRDKAFKKVGLQIIW